MRHRDFAAVTGREEDLVAQQARLADLTVVPHPEAGTDVSSSDALHAVLFDSGPAGADRAAVRRRQRSARACAWPGTAPRKSAACVAAAMPWLQRAEAVRILTADGYQRRGPAAAELAGYLALHGMHAGDRDVPAGRPLGGRRVAGGGAEFGADLLSMGAYSHSRLRQLILGGVTRHVLEHADVPVLMNR